MNIYTWISIGLLVLVSAFIVVTGLRKVPAIGTVVSAILVAIYLFMLGKRGLIPLGYFAPTSWLATLLWGLGLGILLGFLIPLVIEPASEKMVEERHDAKRLAGVRGDWQQLLLNLGLAFVLGAVLEESVFRGFLMTQLGRLIGFNGVYAAILLFVSAAIFGVAHWNRGKSGVLSAVIVGLLIGNVFVWDGYNMWMLIITRAAAETVGLLLIFLNQDTRLRKLIWKAKK